MSGMVTAAMIDLISSGSDMRATPPSLRMSAGTRSSAITAHAPASWAILACSGVTTSMMTPPFSIWARPALTLKDPLTDPFPLRRPLVSATIRILRGDPGPSALPRLVATNRRFAGAQAWIVATIRHDVGSALEPLQDHRARGGVFVVGQQPVAVQPGQHVHLLEHVEERSHGAAGQVRVR